MTLQQETRLRAIIEGLRETSTTKFRVDHFELIRIWNNAVRFNRKQNDLLKTGDRQDIVKTFTIKCEDIDQVINVSVKADKQYSRDQWFSLLVAVDSLFYTRQLVVKHLTFVSPS